MKLSVGVAPNSLTTKSASSRPEEWCLAFGRLSADMARRAKERRRRHTPLMNSTTATWPEWKAAKPGQRVRMNRTGSTGTVLNVNRFGVRVQWDESEYAGVVVAPAFDLTAI
jgi:hypothetical protein